MPSWCGRTMPVAKSIARTVGRPRCRAGSSHFKRAFFDDGQALGSSANAEARIDLIAQAWSALSGAAEPGQQSAALESMDAQPVDPPLGLALPSAGYIQAYPPGVRENGGQYSHAGVWAMMALAARTRDAGDPPRQPPRPRPGLWRGALRHGR